MKLSTSADTATSNFPLSKGIERGVDSLELLELYAFGGFARLRIRHLLWRWIDRYDFGGAVIKGYAEEKLQHLMQLVKTKLPIDSGGAISYAARVNAVRGST